MTGIFVVHVPHDQGGMIGITFSQFADQSDYMLVIGGAVWTVMTTRAMPQGCPICCDGEDFRLLVHQPGGRRGSGRGEIDTNPIFMKQIHQSVEPGKVKPT